jgi:4-alpha-glucanotransferase
MWKFIQYEFFTQWAEIKKYANDKGIQIIGDIPIYVSFDSCDVWANKEQFLLDKDNVPSCVAGVPPDYFAEEGQLWGNPIYDWKKMQKDNFSWWRARLSHNLTMFDAVRIDHFRGIESYWSIPAHHETARYGRWVKGPGMALIGAIRRAYPDVRFLAEDLGYQSPELRELLEQSGYPGMKVLEFAFDSREPSDYLPHVYNEHCVCYTGTHDNLTLRQWYEESSPNDLDRNYARKYMGISDGEDFCEAIIRLGMASKADLFMAQMQDYLNLGGESRMNEPGTLKSRNWRWRMLPGAASPELAKQIAARTETHGRA